MLNYNLNKIKGCVQITTVFSHAQTVVVCNSCSTVLCQPTGGRARLTEGYYHFFFFFFFFFFCLNYLSLFFFSQLISNIKYQINKVVHSERRVHRKYFCFGKKKRKN